MPGVDRESNRRQVVSPALSGPLALFGLAPPSVAIPRERAAVIARYGEKRSATGLLAKFQGPWSP